MSSVPQRFGLFRNAPNARVLPARTVVFREGDDGTVMYAVKRGTVRVVRDGKTLDTLGEDEVFGEMALLDHTTRSATVETVDEAELVEISKAEFYVLVRQNPHFALQLMRLLSDRLRDRHALNQFL